MTDSVTRHKIHPVIPACGLRTAAEINGVFGKTQFLNLMTSIRGGGGGEHFTAPFDKVLHLLKSIFFEIV